MLAAAMLVSGVLALTSGAFPSEALATCVNPSVSLSTSTTTVDSNNPNATLTATLSAPLCAGSAVAVYNELGSLVRAHYWYDPLPGNQLSFTESPPENQTRTYTAYVVSGNVPSPGPPSGVTGSNSVTVQHLGWPGTVTLTTSGTEVDSSSPNATLTATLSRPLPPGSILSIYDERGSYVIYRYWYELGGGTQLTINVSPPEYVMRTYAAYVANHAPYPGPPTLGIRATSEEVTVEHLGWNGTVTSSSNRTQVDASNPYATLTATASRPLTGGYRLSVYDDLGNRLSHKYWYEGSQLSFSVSPPLSQTRTYIAYIAQDAPTPGPPKTMVRAVASLTFASGVLTSQRMEGVDLTWLAGLATDEEFALLLSAAPMATHAQGSSLSDQTLIYEAARAAGVVVGAALALAAAEQGVGASLLWWLADELDGHEAQPPAAPTEALPIPAPPVITSVLPRSNPATFEDELTDIYLERAQAAARAISTVAAQTAARTCVALAAFSISRQSLGPSIDGKHPCEALPIFLRAQRIPKRQTTIGTPSRG